MKVLKEILTKDMKKLIDNELDKISYYKFISEKDIEEKKKKRYNFWLEKVQGKDKIKNHLGYGVYYIFDKNEELVYIGEGDIRGRLRNHFHSGNLFGNNIKESELKKIRKEYKIKYIVISSEFNNKVKYQCRYLEQASYLFFDKEKLYKYDGNKSQK